MVKRKRRGKKHTRVFILVILGLIVSTVAFFYSLYFLVSPMLEQKPEARDYHAEFVEKLVPQAQNLQNEYGVLPSIILGQAILESDWGNSRLASEYHNLFGVKASDGEKMVTLETKEYVNEEWITIQGNFKVYASWEESMLDHTLLFVNGVTWNPGKYAGVLQAKNYQEAAQALQTAGYATDPDYASKVINVIEENKLNQYDQ